MQIIEHELEQDAMVLQQISDYENDELRNQLSAAKEGLESAQREIHRLKNYSLEGLESAQREIHRLKNYSFMTDPELISTKKVLKSTKQELPQIKREQSPRRISVANALRVTRDDFVASGVSESRLERLDQFHNYEFRERDFSHLPKHLQRQCQKIAEPVCTSYLWNLLRNHFKDADRVAVKYFTRPTKLFGYNQDPFKPPSLPNQRYFGS